jgi:hypothetical protein
MTTTQQPAPTALLPLDPAVTPQQALRVLPIRANLLPDEITAGRTDRRTRTILIFAVVLTIAVLGGWYLYAVTQRSSAVDDLAQVTRQVDSTRGETKAAKYTKVTSIIADRDMITSQLKTVMANDLPWSTVATSLRDTKVKHIKVTSIVGLLAKDAVAAPATGTTRSVATLSILGDAKDKRNIAEYIDAVAKVKGVTHVYLTSASGDDSGVWTFSINADLSGERLCGRFTTACPSGGK